MFKYSPKRQISRELETKEAVENANVILKKFHIENNFITSRILRRYFNKIVFFSNEKRKQIPVNGFLFPVEMFEEQKI